MGWEAKGVFSVKEAHEYLLQETPLLVLLDLMLPDGDGSMILSEIRHKGTDIKVVITSGLDNDKWLESISKLKPDEFFQKPVDCDKLFELLEKIKDEN